jgi:hypothetical protein
VDFAVGDEDGAGEAVRRNVGERPVKVREQHGAVTVLTARIRFGAHPTHIDIG